MSKFRELVEKFNKEAKAELVTKGTTQFKYDLIPFSSPTATYMLHGGIPEGRVIEFFGEEASGKTTSAIDIMKNAQIIYRQRFEKELEELQATMGNKKSQIAKYNELLHLGPKKLVFFDIEQTFDEVWANKIGLDTSEVIFVRPQAQTAEELLELMTDMFSSGEVGLIVLDSVPSLATADQLGKTLNDSEMRGGVSKILTSFFRRALPYLNQNHATLILINQLRDSMDPYKMYTTPGGRALKYHSSVRLLFRKGKLIDEDFEEIKRSSERAYGNIVQIRLEKTKVCKPDRLLGSYTISYNDGIVPEVDLIDMCISLNFILKTGSWFTFINAETGEPFYNEEGRELKVQGRAKVITYLRENEELFNHYSENINKMILED